MNNCGDLRATIQSPGVGGRGGVAGIFSRRQIIYLNPDWSLDENDSPYFITVMFI